MEAAEAAQGSSEQRGLDTLVAGANERRTPRRCRGAAVDSQGPPAPSLLGDSVGLSPFIQNHDGSLRAPPCVPCPGPPVPSRPSPGSSVLRPEASTCLPGGHCTAASLCSHLVKGRVPPSLASSLGVCHKPWLGLCAEHLLVSSQSLSVGTGSSRI